MNIISKGLYTIERAKFNQKLNKTLTTKKADDFFDVFFPIAEPVLAKTIYVTKIHKSKDIPKERKMPLMIQSITGGVMGLTLGIMVNKATKNFKNKVLKEIELTNIQNKAKVMRGFSILFPLVVTTIVMRYFVSVASVPFSVYLNKKIEDNKKRKKLLT